MNPIKKVNKINPKLKIYTTQIFQHMKITTIQINYEMHYKIN